MPCNLASPIQGCLRARLCTTHPDIFKRVNSGWHLSSQDAPHRRETLCELITSAKNSFRLNPVCSRVRQPASPLPQLDNAYDHPLIRFTNNATERLIRRFDQHYQNFAGFDSIETARCYLHLFELTYRFTPFGPEVQPYLRGKCPLELAGYDLTQVPLARYLSEHGTVPLVRSAAQVEVVPK
jgi:hypothetical protein